MCIYILYICIYIYIYIYNFRHIYSYIQYFVFQASKSCQRDVIFYLEVINIIPTNQLSFACFATSIRKFVMKGKKQPFPPTGTSVSHEIFAKLRNIRKIFF